MRTKPYVDHQGNHFDSFKEMAEAYGMPAPQLRARLIRLGFKDSINYSV